MYEWVEDVDKLIGSLKGEVNNIATRNEVTKNIIEILNKHKVQAFVDCSPKVNSADVVSHGEFRASIELKTITMLFKFIRKVGKVVKT